MALMIQQHRIERRMEDAPEALELPQVKLAAEIARALEGIKVREPAEGQITVESGHQLARVSAPCFKAWARHAYLYRTSMPWSAWGSLFFCNACAGRTGTISMCSCYRTHEDDGHVPCEKNGTRWDLKLHVHSVLEAELELWAHVKRPMVVSASDSESQKFAIAEPCSTLLATRSEVCAAGPLTHACLPPDLPNRAGPECAGSQLAGLMQSAAVHPKRPSASQHSNSTTQTFAEFLDPLWGSRRDVVDARLRLRSLGDKMGLQLTSEQAEEQEAARAAQRRLLRLQSVTRMASARSIARSRRHRTRSDQERQAAQRAARERAAAAEQALAAAAYAAARANVRPTQCFRYL